MTVFKSNSFFKLQKLHVYFDSIILRLNKKAVTVTMNILICVNYDRLGSTMPEVKNKLLNYSHILLHYRHK